MSNIQGISQNSLRFSFGNISACNSLMNLALGYFLTALSVGCSKLLKILNIEVIKEILMEEQNKIQQNSCSFSASYFPRFSYELSVLSFFQFHPLCKSLKQTSNVLVS